MNKYTVKILAGLVLAGSCNVVLAAGPEEGTINPATANLNFVEPATISHELTPVSPQLSNQISDLEIMANGHVVSGTDALLALRFTPTGNQTIQDFPTIVNVKGTSSESNLLGVLIRAPASNTVPAEDGTTWIVTNDEVKSIDYTLEKWGTDNVPVDTYVVSVDAAVWQY